MSAGKLTVSDKPKEHPEMTPQQVAEQLTQLTDRLQGTIPKAAQDGDSFGKTERKVWQSVLQVGHQAMQWFVMLQGDCDLGEEVTTDQGQTLRRWPETQATKIRSIFGEHQFDQFTYSPGKNKRVGLWPTSARMSLPENRWAHLLEEFSQLFCVESAFGHAADNLGVVLGGQFSVDTLEQTSRRMGQQAGPFLDHLPQAEADGEGNLLVASADCKWVPLVKEDATRIAAFETAKKRPGNRKMATVTTCYSIEPQVRTAEQVVESLFRERPEEKDETATRQRRQGPRPKNKTRRRIFPRFPATTNQKSPLAASTKAPPGWPTRCSRAAETGKCWSC